MYLYLEFRLLASVMSLANSMADLFRMDSHAQMENSHDTQNRGGESRSGAKSVVQRLRCLNCGQLIFAAAEVKPPEVCQYCDDMTTWQVIDGRMQRKKSSA